MKLTENQIQNWTPFGIWKRFSYINGEVIGISETKPDAADILLFKQKLSELADTIPAEVVVSKFNPELAIAREAKVFVLEEFLRLMPFAYVINEMIRFRNFWGSMEDGNSYPGLKQIGRGLVKAGQILQSDYDKLAGILAEQGIDLNAG
jgi:hypothetical protein